MATFGLIAIVVLAVGFAGVLAYYGVAASGPGQYPVTGTVYSNSANQGGSRPAVGATVTLDEEGGASTTTSTDLDGNFGFSDVPSGGMTLHVSLTGYASATVSTFASPVYNAGTTGIAIFLVPTGTGNSTNASLAPFPDLESFLASIGTGIVLLGLVAGVALIAAVLTVRHDRPAMSIVGGGAGLSAPFALYLLGLDSAFPIVIAATTALAAFGGFTLALRAIELGQTGPMSRTD